MKVIAALPITDRTLVRTTAVSSRRAKHQAALLLLGGAVLSLTLAFIHHRSRHAVATESPNLPEVDGHRIVFSQSFADRIGLEAIELTKSDIVPAFSVVGTVTFDPAHVARIGARLRGVVRDVLRYEGSQVKAGEVLAAIDSPELGEAQASVATLAAMNSAAQQQWAREQQLAARQLTAARHVEEAYADAERSEALLSAAKQRVSALSGNRAKSDSRRLGVHILTSPLTGTLIERHVSKGQLIDANHMAFLVANLDHVWVELLVFERNLPSIKVGDRVELHAESSGSTDDIVNGEVAQVSAVLQSNTRGATVRVRVDNRERKFRPGQSVNATIRATAATVDDAPTVPSSAIIYVDGKPSVFVADSPTSVIVSPVQLGETNGQAVHVREGVEAGQRVVVRGTIELRNQLFR